MFITPITATKYTNYKRIRQTNIQEPTGLTRISHDCFISSKAVNFKSAKLYSLSDLLKPSETYAQVIEEIITSLDKGVTSLSRLQREKLKPISVYCAETLNPFVEEVTSEAIEQLHSVYSLRELMILRGGKFKHKDQNFKAKDGLLREIEVSHKSGFSIYDWQNHDGAKGMLIRRFECHDDYPDNNYEISIFDINKGDDEVNNYTIAMSKSGGVVTREIHAEDLEAQVVKSAVFRENGTLETIGIDNVGEVNSYSFAEDGFTVVVPKTPEIED